LVILGKTFFAFQGERNFSSLDEGLGDIFRGKCTYLGKKKGENVKFYVKFRNFESMTKKSHQKFWRMKRHIFREKSHGMFLDSLRNF